MVNMIPLDKGESEQAMVGASKILTVSYGTFSCTLEGFDDSFGTMKAIAEYFRDLAADDRYFGAEPPTPDAEMLQRIAEREIHKRVEARMDASGIVLRADDNQKLPARAPEPQPAPAPAPQAAAPEVVAPAPQPAPAEDIAGPGSVAAKLARIRAVVETARAAPADFIEDEHAADAHEEDALEEDGLTDISGAFEDAVAQEEAVEEPEAVAETDEEEEDDATVLSSISGALRDVADKEDEDAAAVLDAGEEAFEDEVEKDEELAAILTGVTEDDATAEDEGDLEDEAIADQDDTTAAPLILGDDDVEDVEDEDADADILEAEAVQDLYTDEDEDDLPAVSHHGLAQTEEVEASDEDEDDLSAARARVLTVKTADLDALEDEAGEYEDDNILSEDDEADLLAELAEVERDAAAILGPDLTGWDDDEDEEGEDDQIEDAAIVEDDETPAERDGRSRLQSTQPDDEKAVSRLLEETNTKLEGPENQRRRSAISHLKAAVAATVAERRLRPGKDRDAEAEAEKDPYRQDLAEVVRPRRAVKSGETHTERSPLPPLMLVSEQRIDAPKPAAENAAPVRPRRVSSGNLALRDDKDEDSFADGDADENLFRGEISFAEYAGQTGAEELPALVEAAATYAIELEGRPHFSRPQLMKTISEHVGSEDFSREDTLRAFGKLLRDGTIRKIKRGQFTLGHLPVEDDED